MSLPYTHQRLAVKMLFDKNSICNSVVFAHDMGLGKTFTALQAVAAFLVRIKRMPKTLISVPAVVLEQWTRGIFEWLRLSSECVLVIHSICDCTPERIRNADVVLITHTMVGLLFKASPLYENNNSANKRPRSSQANASIFTPPNGTWDLLIIDEVHKVRGLDTLTNPAHALLPATKRIGLTGTMVVNAPRDMAGIAAVLQTPPRHGVNFTLKESWILSRDHSTVNRRVMRLFNAHYVHRATENAIQLPKLYEEAVSYPVAMSPSDVEMYNRLVAAARNLRHRVAVDGRLSTQDAAELWSKITVMQQMVVDSDLARVGAAAFHKSCGLLKELHRRQRPSGALLALTEQVARMRSIGHCRIVVACDAVAPLNIARSWMQTHQTCFGTCFGYDGSMTTKARIEAVKNFLLVPSGLLFLSIQAGGTGLHLVPGCECMIFWSSSPFSPAHKRQCMKRIHRLGQHCPITGRVTIIHMVPYGSVDFAIHRMHADKASLIKFANDPTDASAFINENDGCWRKYGRIVDECLELGQDGNFPTPPRYEKGPDGSESGIPYALVPGVPPEQTIFL
jgi:hypothetical protein